MSESELLGETAAEEASPAPAEEASPAPAEEASPVPAEEASPAPAEEAEGPPAVAEAPPDEILWGRPEEPAAGEPGFEPPEAMCQMLFVDVALVLPSTYPVVVLQEADPPYRELRIPVGGAEGVAIGYAARQVDTPRPLTHEMVSRLLDAFELSLDSVRITGLEGANFVAELVITGRYGVRTIDCRPSDGIALALRRPIAVPIMAAPEVLDRAGGGAASGN